jgi:hypothetical protein
MDVPTVYTISKALPEEEFNKLFYLNKEDMKLRFPKQKKQVLFTDEDAINYLIKNVFSKV